MEKEATTPRTALPPVPESCALNIARLGDAPVLEWPQRGGFPPWSLAFIPSQRNGGGTNLESKSHQSSTRGGGELSSSEGVARVALAQRALVSSDKVSCQKMFIMEAKPSIVSMMCTHEMF